MPSLEAYSRDLPYQRMARDVAALRALCAQHHVREEQADKALSRISGKENCFAAVVFDKFQSALSGGNHLVLHHPSDKGNLGTMLRTALGFGYRDIAVIRPAADAFDPHVVRASMGAIFGLNLRYYDDFEQYRLEFPANMCYPFMLDASVPLAEAAAGRKEPFALIMGNEGSGLPAAFARLGQPVRIPHNGEIDSLNLSVAAAIGMYAFANQ